jgi:hypothetical protein
MATIPAHRSLIVGVGLIEFELLNDRFWLLPRHRSTY